MTGGKYVTREELERLQIPDITIQDQIGQGANALVFEAYHNLYNKRYALKIWKEEACNKKIAAEKFKNEISKIKSIPSDKKINYIDEAKYFEKGGSVYFYYLMDFVSGVTLKEYLNERGSSKSAKINDIKLLSKILDALSYAHKNHVYHGDIHSENILVIGKNDPVLIDFGTSMLVKEKFHRLRSCWLIIQTCEKLIKNLNIPEKIYYPLFIILKRYADNSKQWRELKKDYKKFPEELIYPELIVEFYKTLIDLYAFREYASLEMFKATSSSVEISDLSFSFLRSPIFELSNLLDYLLEEKGLDDKEFEKVKKYIGSSFVNGNTFFNRLDLSRFDYQDIFCEIFNNGTKNGIAFEVRKICFN